MDYLSCLFRNLIFNIYFGNFPTFSISSSASDYSSILEGGAHSRQSERGILKLRLFPKMRVFKLDEHENPTEL